MVSIHHHNCPVCGSSSIQPVFSVKDETVSGLLFEIWECGDCRLRFTQDTPAVDEIGVFYDSPDYISHSDKAPGFINRIYRAVRRRTLDTKKNLIRKYTGIQKGRLLDVGSGTGAFVDRMTRQGWSVTGLEPDPGARQHAEDNYGVKLQEAERIYQLPGNEFDAITMWHVLEHVHDLHGYLERLRSLLKENGRLFIAVPNYTSKDADIYGRHWAAYDVPRHLYHFSPRSMRLLLDRHALQIVDEKPMWFDSFYISMLSNKYRKGKTGMLSALFNGLRSNLVALRDVERCSSVIYIIAKTEPRKAPATTSR